MTSDESNQFGFNFNRSQRCRALWISFFSNALIFLAQLSSFRQNPAGHERYRAEIFLRLEFARLNDAIKLGIIRRGLPISAKRKIPFIGDDDAASTGGAGGRRDGCRANGCACIKERSTCCAFLYVIVIRSSHRPGRRAMSNGRSNLFGSIYYLARTAEPLSSGLRRAADERERERERGQGERTRRG